MTEILTLLDDRHTGRKDLIAEHGLSMYVCRDGKQILFDCGSSGAFLRNAEKLGIDLKNLDAVVLSHSHYDHAAGFPNLIRQGGRPGCLYTGPGFFEPKYARRGDIYADLSAAFDRKFLEDNDVVQKGVYGLREIFPGTYLLSGFPRTESMETIPERFCRRTGAGLQRDDFRDEVCLALDTAEGLVLLVGCSHPGIVNMVRHVRRTLNRPVRAVFGGTHLVEADPERVTRTVEALKGMGVRQLGLSHCSGEGTIQLLTQDPEINACSLGPGDWVFFM